MLQLCFQLFSADVTSPFLVGQTLFQRGIVLRLRAMDDPFLRCSVGAGLRLGKGLAEGWQPKMAHLRQVNKLTGGTLTRLHEGLTADLGQPILFIRRIEELAVEGAAATAEDCLLDQQRVSGLQLCPAVVGQTAMGGSAGAVLQIDATV